MSAYIMNDSDLYLIAKAVQPSNVQEFSDLLKRININSVNYRYSEKTRVFKCKPLPYITCAVVNPEMINSLIKCWSYQSCEAMDNKMQFSIVDGYLKLWMLENTYKV